MDYQNSIISAENISRDTTDEQAVIIAQLISNLNFLNSQIEDIVKVIENHANAIKTLQQEKNTNSFSKNLDNVLKSIGNFKDSKPRKITKKELKNELDLLLSKTAYDEEIDLDVEVNNLYNKMYGEV